MTRLKSSRPGTALVGVLIVAFVGGGSLLALTRLGNEASDQTLAADAQADPFVCTVTDEELVCEAETDCNHLESAAAGPPCRPCPRRRWCGCYYNYNDRLIPRISCDPCCYWNLSLPYPICLD